MKLKRVTSFYWAALALGIWASAGDIALAQGAEEVVKVEQFAKGIIKIITGLASLVATFFFIVGGYSYMASSGSPERLTKAKRTIFYSGVGLAVTVSAYVLSTMVAGLATDAFGA